MSQSGGFRQLLRVLSWPRWHVGTSGRVGLEQKEEEQPLGNASRVPHCKSLGRPISSEVHRAVGRDMGPGIQSRVTYSWRRAGILGLSLLTYWAERVLIVEDSLVLVGYSAAFLSSTHRSKAIFYVAAA